MRATKTNIFLYLLYHSTMMRLKNRLVQEVTVTKTDFGYILRGLDSKNNLVAITKINTTK